MLGKEAYTGVIAEKYEEDRVCESIWDKEQEYVAGFIASLSGSETILDLPVGTGRFLPLFGAKGLRVIAADISTDMLAEAKRKIAAEGNVAFQIEDVEKLSLADNACDHVVCWRLAHLLQPSELEQAIFEFSRVTRQTIRMQFFFVERDICFLRKVARKVKVFFQKPLAKAFSETEASAPETPWRHIQTFTHSHEHIVAAAQRAGLSLAGIEGIEDENNPELVYVFAKTGQ